MFFSEAVSFSSGLSGMSLKEEQLSAIKAVYEGRNVFVCLPTGYGKSKLCRLLWNTNSSCGDRAVIIVSALVAILSSSSSASKDNIGTEECLCRDNLYFCVPEAVTTAKWRDVLERELSDCGHISG